MSDQGRQQVAQALARILAAKYPGTHWAPAEPGAKQTLRLADPPDRAAVSDRSDGGRRAA